MTPPEYPALLARARRAYLRAQLYDAYPAPVGAGLLFESLPQDLACTQAEFLNTMFYLEGRGHVARAGQARGSVPLWTITPAGIHKREAAEDFNPYQRERVRMLRLRLLQGLAPEVTGRRPLGLRLIACYLETDTDLDVGNRSLLRALHYLAEPAAADLPALIRIDGSGDDTKAIITADGIDYLAGPAHPREGIARPTDWS